MFQTHFSTCILIVFFLSINFNIFWFLNLIKKTIFKLFSKKEKILDSNKSINNEVESLSPIYNKPVQEDLPFISNENNKNIAKVDMILSDFIIHSCCHNEF